MGKDTYPKFQGGAATEALPAIYPHDAIGWVCPKCGAANYDSCVNVDGPEKVRAIREQIGTLRPDGPAGMLPIAVKCKGCEAMYRCEYPVPPDDEDPGDGDEWKDGEQQS